MAKQCPDLTALTDQELRDFWEQHEPESLKLVGDRLMAESLPTREPRTDLQATGIKLLELRRNLGWKRGEVALKLGVTEEVIKSWEREKMRPPESLMLIYEKSLSQKNV